MFKLNVQQKTKNGETLFPFTVKGDMAYCFDKNKNTVIRPLTDFYFTSKKTKMKIVTPKLESEDQIFKEEEKNEELFSTAEDSKAENNTTENNTAEDSKAENNTTENNTAEDNKAEDNSEEEKPSDIWSTIGDSYI